jgi:RNA polymerase sigma-70 factor (ECF subfamily)
MTATMLQQEEASDHELIGRASNGDRDAFGELVERHYGFVYRVAYRLCGNRVDAEDVAQEVCVRIGKAIRGYRGQGAFTTWLYTLTLNAVRDMIRRAGRETAKAAAWGAEAMSLIGSAEAEEDPAEALWNAVRQLPAKQRDAVTLVYGEGLSHAEAADAMGCSENTVSWHVHEARKRLKVLMTGAGEV